MKKVLEKISIASIGLFTPALVFAQNVDGIQNLLESIYNILRSTIPVLIALALVAFMWGIVRYLFTQNKDDAKTFMIWGIIALFVMTSVWGLVGILRGTLFNQNGDNAQNVGLPDYR